MDESTHKQTLPLCWLRMGHPPAPAEWVSPPPAISQGA